MSTNINITPPKETPQLQKSHQTNDFLEAFLPNRSIHKSTLWILIGCQVAIAIAVWWTSPLKIIPRPMEVFAALGELWMKNGLGEALMTSFTISVKALGITVIASLALAYLTVLPFFRPILQAISKGRFLSLVGPFLSLYYCVWWRGCCKTCQPCLWPDGLYGDLFCLYRD